MYLPSESKNNQVKSNEVLTQLKKLNDLYKDGVLTKEEFEKAKKRSWTNSIKIYIEFV